MGGRRRGRREEESKEGLFGEGRELELELGERGSVEGVEGGKIVFLLVGGGGRWWCVGGGGRGRGRKRG